MFRERAQNWRVLPLKLETSKIAMKPTVDGYNDHSSPSYVDKNSTHDNKIFDGNSNSFRHVSDPNLKKASRELTPLGC